MYDTFFYHATVPKGPNSLSDPVLRMDQLLWEPGAADQCNCLKTDFIGPLYQFPVETNRIARLSKRVDWGLKRSSVHCTIANSWPKNVTASRTHQEQLASPTLSQFWYQTKHLTASPTHQKQSLSLTVLPTDQEDHSITIRSNTWQYHQQTDIGMMVWLTDQSQVHDKNHKQTKYNITNRLRMWQLC